MGLTGRLPGKVGAETMNGVDAELNKDIASTPCNTHMAVVAERSLFPCNNGESNRQRTPTVVGKPREPNTAESPLLRKGSILTDGHRRKVSGTPTEAAKASAQKVCICKLARRFTQSKLCLKAQRSTLWKAQGVQRSGTWMA
jgi:hypothetical protein